MKNTIKNIFSAMVSLSLTLSLSVPLALPLARSLSAAEDGSSSQRTPPLTLRAAEYDSSTTLPPMTLALQATKTAGKDFADYLALRRREAEIFAELTELHFDALSGLDSGDLERRISCLEGLLSTPGLLAEYGPQLDAKVRRLMGDAMGSDDLALPARLWEVCARLPQVRPELEIEMLKSRLETLITSTEGKPRQRATTRKNLAKSLRDTAAQTEQWTPGQELWGKS